MNHTVKIVAACCLFGLAVAVQAYQQPAKIMESFEDGVPEGLRVTGRSLSLDTHRMKHGAQSLRWDWQGNDVLTFDTPIGYRRQRLIPEVQATRPGLHADPASGILEPPHGFFMWIYNDESRPQRLRIQFGRGDTIDCEFDYHLRFKGWRTIALNYDRGDMRGVPREDMTRMTINAPATGGGTFFFDTLGFSVPMNPRTVNANPQLPEIDRHPRLVAQYPHLLYEWSKQTPTFNLEPLTPSVVEDFRALERQATAFWVTESERSTRGDAGLDRARKLYERFEIRRDGDHIYGRPLVNKNTLLEYFSEMGMPKEEMMDGIFEWRYAFGGTLLSIARAWYYTDSPEAKRELEEMFVDLFEYGIDQGFDTGAGLGWIHHYSYIIREYAPSMFLMRDVLKRRGLLGKAVEVCKWFHGFNQVYREDVVYDCEGRVAGNADEMQGLLTQRLLCALLMEDSPEKARDLRHFSSYFSNVATGYAHALDETFKPDGTVFHHAGHALGYGGRAIYGAVRALHILRGTSFEASDAAHHRLRNVVRTYHDVLFGEAEMAPKAFASIRFGNYRHPSNFDGMDEMLGASYEALDGFRSLSYTCVGLKRQKNDWMITVRGHSKYVYPFESWGTSFFAFPLFIANGYLDVSYPDDLDSLTPTDGIWHPGLDWRRWPGSTTVRLPYEQLYTRVGQVRDEGGEYLFGDRAFSGGVETGYGCGIYVFPFKGHHKYGIDSFTGKKSYFFAGNKVVCLGTDIRSDRSEHRVETTLFQTHLSTPGDRVMVNGPIGYGDPSRDVLDIGTPRWLVDPRGTGYYVESIGAAATLHLACGEQVEPDAHNQGMSTGRFATVWIDHGKAPRDGSYRYVLVADTDPEDMQALAESMAGDHPPIEILRMDEAVHAVALNGEDAMAYAVYDEDGATFGDGPVRAVDRPSTFIVRQEGERLRLSVADPDLNIYDGQDDLLPDGSRCELSIYEREWFYWPSRPTRVRITLEGSWRLEEVVNRMETATRQARLVASGPDATTIGFECRDGLSAEVLLVQVSAASR